MFEKFEDYMYYLLFTPLKKIIKKDNQFYILFKVFGKIFDQTKKDILEIRKQSMIISATGRALEEHGADRNLKKFKDEDEESYRIRLSMKNIIAEKAGSNEGIILALKSLGYENPKVEPYYIRNPERWAEFSVIIDESEMDIIKDFNIVRNNVKAVKMASSLPNYGFGIHTKIVNKIYARTINRVFLNFRGNIPLYIDGTWKLNGDKVLDGHEVYKEPITVSMTNRVIIPTNEIFKVKVTTKKNLWYLDGTYELDGAMTLDAEIIEEEI